MDSNSDKPRKIVVCHPDDFVKVNAAVMSLKLGDVLVQRSSLLIPGKTYVMNNPFDLIA